MTTDASATNADVPDHEKLKSVITRLVVGFIAGFLATIAFHQGLLALLHNAGLTDREPWSMTPVPPLGVPAFASLAFWGGLWGMALIFLLPRSARRSIYWVRAFLLGAILPSLVAWFVVAPLKGQPMLGGGAAQPIIGALLLNGAWGIGTALFIQLLLGMRGRSSERSI